MSLSAKIGRLPSQLRDLIAHPMNRGNRMDALKRWLAWQVSARLAPGPVAVPFVDDVRLLISPGLAGATGNVHFGLAEYQEMSFALHLLRPDELFVDIGANIGAYSMLAAAAGAHVLAFEPVEASATRFETNMRLNDFAGRVELRRVALGASSGTVAMTDGLDAMNHVTDAASAVTVAMETLDQALGERAPTLIKIDVEGYEPEILRGASRVLAARSLIALIVETEGWYQRYNFTREDLEAPLRKAGFAGYGYDPHRRELLAASKDRHNTIFLRDKQNVMERLRSARRFRTLAGSI